VPAEQPADTTAQFRALYEHNPDGVLFTSPDGRVFAANPAACEMLGRAEQEICSLGRVGLTDSGDERWEALVEERRRTGSTRGVGRMLRGDGTLIEVEVSARIFSDADGEQRTCTVMRDVTERVRMDGELLRLSAQLRELTLTDELTGLHNRRGFMTISSQLLEVADRQQLTATVLFVDVDNMKALNDGHGHAAGDAALRAVAAALRHALRSADALARFAGDEFVALALGLDDHNRVSIEQRIAEHLRRAVFPARRVEVSLGWTTRSPHDRRMVEDLIGDADRSMYEAKALRVMAAAAPDCRGYPSRSP
jgi:diguanylate cyclase (GGDEF)-like protein/PAS domain S-box-containing protein